MKKTIITALIVLMLIIPWVPSRAIAQSSTTASIGITNGQGQSNQWKVGATYTAKVYLRNPSSRKITSYELIVTYPKDKIEITKLDGSMSPLKTPAIERFDNATGNVELSRVQIDTNINDIAKTAMQIAEITFRAKSNGDVRISPSGVIIFGLSTSGNPEQLGVAGNENLNIQIIESDTITPPPPITPSPTPYDTNCIDLEAARKTGDYNCDGTINATDLQNWIFDFKREFSTLKYFELWRRAFYK